MCHKWLLGLCTPPSLVIYDIWWDLGSRTMRIFRPVWLMGLWDGIILLARHIKLCQIKSVYSYWRRWYGNAFRFTRHRSRDLRTQNYDVMIWKCLRITDSVAMSGAHTHTIHTRIHTQTHTHTQTNTKAPLYLSSCAEATSLGDSALIYYQRPLFTNMGK